MNYEFPQDIELGELREAIARANERLGSTVFIEADRGDHLIFNYVVQFPEVFPSMTGGEQDREFALLRECRGLTMSPDGKVLARKFHKFFNLNEREETLHHTIDWSRDHAILTKFDGSMIAPFIPMGQRDVVWGTKMGATEVATKVEPFMKANPEYVEFALGCIFNGLTPLFEFCSPRQRIVIRYPEDRLVLLAVRDNITGAYLNAEQVEARIGVSAPKDRVGDFGRVEDIVTFINDTRELKGSEGWVVRFEDGHMLKVKAEEYVTIHRAISNVSSEKFIIRSILDDSVDDVIALLPEEDRDDVRDFVNNFQRGLTDAAERITNETAALMSRVDGDARGFAEAIADHDSVTKPAMFRASRGGDAREMMVQTISKNLGSQTRIDRVRHLWGGAAWDGGMFMEEE